MKVAQLRFRDAAVRRTYLDLLRERMYAAGYSPDYVTDWIRGRFDPKLHVAHVFGRDDADRAADVALEVRGVSCKMEDAT
jgi:hypothetical protein